MYDHHKKQKLLHCRPQRELNVQSIYRERPNKQFELNKSIPKLLCVSFVHKKTVKKYENRPSAKHRCCSSTMFNCTWIDRAMHLSSRAGGHPQGTAWPRAATAIHLQEHIAQSPFQTAVSVYATWPTPPPRSKRKVPGEETCGSLRTKVKRAKTERKA